MYYANVCEYIFRTVSGGFQIGGLPGPLSVMAEPQAIGSRFRENLAPSSLPFWERSHIPSKENTFELLS